MKIKFLGTRGNIINRNRTHYRHTITIVSYKKTKLVIDYGLDWQGKLLKYVKKPTAIILTHAHPDHAYGLKDGTPCPVYATRASWKVIKSYPIEEKHTVAYNKKYKIGSLTIEPFFVEHSLNAPAVGYRISAGKTTIFCVHDLVSIKNKKKALEDIKLYIGDGASINRPIIRYKNKKPFGHTTIKKQIEWCAQEGVPRAIFTHCGSQILREGKKGEEWVKEIGRELGVKSSIAYDGMQIMLK